MREGVLHTPWVGEQRRLHMHTEARADVTIKAMIHLITGQCDNAQLRRRLFIIAGVTHPGPGEERNNGSCERVFRLWHARMIQTSS